MDLRRDQLMHQADASPPEPAAAEVVQEQIAPTPPQEKPEVVAPPEQKQQPTPQKPEPAKTVPDAEAGASEAQSRSSGGKEANRRRRPRRAPARRRAPNVRPRPRRPISAGAAASAVAAYSQRVRAHLMRFHQYPSGAMASAA